MNDKIQFWLLQIIILLAFVAMTLPYPILAPLILSSSAHSIISSHSMEISLIMGAYPLGLFFGTFLLGGLGDQYGKKKILLVSLFLSGITQIISGYFVTIKIYEWLIITRFFSGLFEGHIAIVRSIVATMYQTEKKRKKHFGHSNAALTLGWVIGPVLGGFFSNSHISHFFKYSTPFYIAAWLTFFVFILTLLKFREPILSFERPSLVKGGSMLPTFNKRILLLLLSSLLMTLGVDSFYQFLPIYLTQDFKATSSIIGLAISLVTFANTFTNIALVSSVDKFINTVNSLILFPMLLSFCLLLLFMNLSPQGIFLVLPFIGILIALIMTNMTSLVSINISSSAQGKLMGYLLSQRSLGCAFISFIMAPAITYHRKLPYMLGALLLILGFCTMVIYKNFLKKAKNHLELNINSSI